MTDLLHPQQETADRLADLHRARIVKEAPLGWAVTDRLRDGDRWVKVGRRGPFLMLIWSIGMTDDGAWWHLSMSARTRMPEWRELREAKDWIIGDQYAYEVLPPSDRYVNIHEGVLHLFAPVDRRPRLPEFSGALPDGARTL